jgi:hypothetical protein
MREILVYQAASSTIVFLGMPGLSTSTSTTSPGFVQSGGLRLAPHRLEPAGDNVARFPAREAGALFNLSRDIEGHLIESGVLDDLAI